MPQASEENRKKYLETFPDIGCEHAIEELKKRGYILTKDWCWIQPREPTQQEIFWIYFLIEEWDFGGIVQDVKCCMSCIDDVKGGIICKNTMCGCHIR